MGFKLPETLAFDLLWKVCAPKYIFRDRPDNCEACQAELPEREYPNNTHGVYACSDCSEILQKAFIKQHRQQRSFKKWETK